MKRYTRKEVAKELGVAPNTIYLWEKKGKVPAPRKLVHNNQLIYTDEHIAAYREFLNAEEPSRVA